MTDSNGVIELHAGRAEVGVVPDIGGSIAYYRWNDADDGRARDWLRPTTETELPKTADECACFPLVPFSNRIRDGHFEFRGRQIRLPLNQWPQPHSEHGHGWQSRWRVLGRSAHGVLLELEHRAADTWPFSYRAVQEITLTEDELRVTLSAENRDRETMPIGLGLHPYFPRTAHCRLSATVDAMWETDEEVMPTRLTQADPRLASGLPVVEVALDNVFPGWRRTATIDWPDNGTRLALSADAPLDFLVVYSPPAQDYFCVEPVSHCTDAFNLAAHGHGDTGMLTLAPGAIVGATVRFRPAVTSQ